MKALLKYAIVLAFGLAVGSYAHGPLSLEDVGRLKWLDEINVVINKALAPAKPPAAVALVDPASAALVDEDLDYRIAQRIASLDGWRSFLAAHGNGVHAQSARAEVERLLRTAKAPAPAAAEVSDEASPDARATSEAVVSGPPSPGTEVAALTPDEICKRDEDRLEQLRGSPTSEEAARFANELGCEKLRPQLLGLMENLGQASSLQAAATPSPPAKVGSAPGPKRRATSPPSKTRGTASSRSLEVKQHANGCAFRSVCIPRASFPPILLALLGDRPKNSRAFRRIPTNARPDDVRGR